MRWLAPAQPFFVTRSEAMCHPGGDSCAPMPVQVRPPCRLQLTAGSWPRLGRGAGAFDGRVHASVAALRPQSLSRPSGASPSLVLVWTVPPPSTRAPAATVLLLRQPSAARSSTYIPVRLRRGRLGFLALGPSAPGRRFSLAAKSEKMAPVEGVRGNGEVSPLRGLPPHGQRRGGAAEPLLGERHSAPRRNAPSSASLRKANRTSGR